MDASFFGGRINDVLSRKERFYDDVINLGPEKIHVDLDLFKMFAKSRETPLESKIIVFKIFALNIVIRLFVDRVVGEMDEFVPFCILWLVFLGGESCKPFFEDIDSERVNACDQNVDSKVKFVPVY